MPISSVEPTSFDGETIIIGQETTPSNDVHVIDMHLEPDVYLLRLADRSLWSTPRHPDIDYQSGAGIGSSIWTKLGIATREFVADVVNNRMDLPTVRAMYGEDAGRLFIRRPS